jgi:lipase chaperone LimK
VNTHLRLGAAIAAATAAIAAAGLLLLRGQPESAGAAPTGERRAAEAPPPPAREAAEAVAAPRSRWDVPATARGPLPASLRGSEPDGRIEVDADGRFVPTPGALLLFDYFLSASGEEPLEVIRGRILLHLEYQLPPEVAGEVAALLDRYLAYREALRGLAESRAGPADLERRWQWIRELRVEHFGAEVAAGLFGPEEQTILVDMERRRVALDETLDEAERAERLAALDERLPSNVREARRRAAAPARVRAEVEARRAEGASEAEIFALREEAFGTDAAERLAALDARRAEWQRRLHDYHAERDALLGDSEFAPEELHGALEALRAEHFEAEELARVRALDRADAEAP